jgi:hypothetical protein
MMPPMQDVVSYQARCNCGATWTLNRPSAEEVDFDTCTACGADTQDITEIGRVHSVGAGLDG